MELFITAAIAFLSQFGSHFIPWAEMMGKRELPRLVSYIIGVSTIAVILTVFWIGRGDWNAIAILWLVIVASGLGVIAGYGLDGLLKLKRSVHEAECRASDAETREGVLMEMRNER